MIVDALLVVAQRQWRIGDAFNGAAIAAIEVLAQVDGKLRNSYGIGGFRRERERHEYEAALAAFPFLPTSRNAFETAARCLARHPKLGPGDAIIAATAIDHEARLFTLDADFGALTREGLELF